MIGLDIKHPYQNVAMATFLHFLGGSQENEIWIAMFVREERDEENSGLWEYLDLLYHSKSPSYYKAFSIPQKRMDMWKQRWGTLQLYVTDFTVLL